MSFFLNPHQSSKLPYLVLASASPRRADLLRLADLNFEVHPSHCCEKWNNDEGVVEYVERIAQNKALTSWRSLTSDKQTSTQASPPLTVLAADTTVWRDPQRPPVGKPANREQAREMIRGLTNGGWHMVTTAYCILSNLTAPSFSIGPSSQCSSVRSILRYESTKVWMENLDDTAIESYLDRNEWVDKAGAYAIQGLAARFITRIEGSYTNVVGLPLAQVLRGLAEIGYGRDG